MRGNIPAEALDSDTPVVKLKESKDRIQKELGNGFCWVTQGREIENYLPALLINGYLSKQCNKPIYVNSSSDDRLGKAIAESIKDEESANTRYDDHQVKYARKFCELMTAGDLGLLDLRGRLDRLIEHIWRWNHLEPGQPDKPASGKSPGGPSGR